MIGTVPHASTVGGGADSPALVERLVREFRNRVGSELDVRPAAQLPGFPSGISLAPAGERGDRAGEFRVLVLESPHEAKLLVHGMRRDSEDIYWRQVDNELSHDPSFWSATKLYGRALLRWWSSDRHVNDRWRERDATVRAAVEAVE